ncbi:GreA/GreB family elongation factor [Patescibacteria group bacterium]|nr:GreA/GreB family elongation factor [Patescibacteria group bacterium]
MRVPIRKGGQYTFMKSDPFMTAEKLAELKVSLEKLKKHIQPELAKEVKRLALMGDFSENAAYQIAKGRLRSTNERISRLTKQISSAQIIEPNKKNQVVQIGSVVTVEVNTQTKNFQILGSLESDPAKGVISHVSPLGQELLGKKIGDIVELKREDQTIKYKIIKIN